jgi:hypothetical protein
VCVCVCVCVCACSMTNKYIGFGTVTGFICLLEYSFAIPASGATATHCSSQFTWAVFQLLLELLELTNGVSVSLCFELGKFLTYAATGVLQRKHMLLPFLSLFYVGNKLVSIDVSVCYFRHMLQQNGYQTVPYCMSQKHAF